MAQLTYDEFVKLPRKEQNVRYKELSSHDRFLARINDWGDGSNLGITVIEEGNMTEEETQKYEEILELVKKGKYTRDSLDE